MAEVLEQYRSICAHDNPRQCIRQWLNHCFKDAKISIPNYASRDYQLVMNFLYSCRGSADTFGSYRRDIERFFQWSWFILGGEY